MPGTWVTTWAQNYLELQPTCVMKTIQHFYCIYY